MRIGLVYPQTEYSSDPAAIRDYAQAVLRRVARMVDGWMPNYRKPAEAQPSLETIERLLEDHLAAIRLFGEAAGLG